MKNKSVAFKTKEDFLKLCKSGVFLPGAKIPSENRMAQMLGVSRETWRNVLVSLRREHIVYSKHGVGTYMADSNYKIKNNLSELKSLSQMISSVGILEKTSKISIEEVEAPEYIIKYLNVDEGEKIYLLQRKRFSEKSAICTSCTYISEKYAKHINRETIPESTFEFLEKVINVYVTSSITKIIVPSKDDSVALDLKEHGDYEILALEQLHFDDKGASIFFSIDYLRCDIFEFSITRTRRK